MFAQGKTAQIIYDSVGKYIDSRSFSWFSLKQFAVVSLGWYVLKFQDVLIDTRVVADDGSYLPVVCDVIMMAAEDVGVALYTVDEPLPG